MADAFPLAWPDGWPRTTDEKDDARGHFSRRIDTGRGWRESEPWTFGGARNALLAEVARVATGPTVLSSNFDLTRNGEPRLKTRPEDQGVAIYWVRKGRSYVMACDRYTRAEENMRSLTLAMEAMRALERHGGGVMMERAFQGFVALPAPKRPHEILGVEASACRADIQKAWRTQIAANHPDQTGSHEAAAEINAARDAMLKAAVG